jgi:amidase
MTFDEYAKLDGVGLAALIQGKQVSRLDVVDAAIETIERLNPKLNAVILTAFDAARDCAEKKIGEGPLAGVPFLLKDVNLYSHDMPTRFASRFFRDSGPQQDSFMVSRWRAGGLAMLGKTNTPEFAGEFVTEPAAYGPTLNPWGMGHTVGGSSGGAAAAVASGMVPLAHGTDLGGSIRIPAACCGVFGFKPTAGLNPLGPHFSEIAGGLDSDHVLTRSVRDSAASLDITGDQPDRFLATLETPLRALRIGVTDTSPEGIQAGANQRQALARVATLLREMGHLVTDYRYPVEAAIGDWFDPLWMVDIHYLVARQAEALGRQPRPDELEPLSRWALEASNRMSAADYFAARMRKQQAAAALEASMQLVDIVLTPALASDPPELGALTFSRFDDHDAWSAAGYGFAPFSAPGNIAGQPSASFPAGLTPDGLPIGVQVTSRCGGDALVLRLCRQIEVAMPWPLLAPD